MSNTRTTNGTTERAATTRATSEERALSRRVAALADVDPRTALRALREGPESVRVLSARDRLAAALASLAGAPVNT